MTVEILVEIAATPNVTLRGSDRRKVLEDGTNYGNFTVHDASLRQSANEFGRPGRRPTDWLDVSFADIDALHDTYDLSGKAVTVRIGQGNSPDDYRKSTVGNHASSVYTWRGFVPTNWTPSPSRDGSRCRLFLSGPLCYQSFPILTDLIDSDSAPESTRGLPYPILFGDSAARSISAELFPMNCIGRVGGALSWALGNLPLTGGPNIFGEVFFNPYTAEDSYSDDVDEDRALWIGAHREDSQGDRIEHNEETLLWYAGSGITTTAARPLPGLAANELVGEAGQVIYWLLRYKANQPAAALDAHGLIAAAPFQFRGGVNIYTFIEGPEEVGVAAGEIADEYGVIIRQIDGNRRHGQANTPAGEEPVWSVADRFVLEPSADDLRRPVDPGWLLKNPAGGDDIRILGPHPLYANRVNAPFGQYPLVLNAERRQLYANSTTIDNAADQEEFGIIEDERRFRWCSQPDRQLARTRFVEGLGSERWSRWTEEDPVALFGFSLRLPMGDVLPGDLIDFGSVADERYYLVEETQLDWGSRSLAVVAARIKDREEATFTETYFSQVSQAGQLFQTRDNYPLRTENIIVATPLASDLVTGHARVYDRLLASYYRLLALDGHRISGLRVRMTANTNRGCRFRLFSSQNAPPQPASPWPGWNSVSGATLLRDSGSFQPAGDVSFDYTLTPAQANGLDGAYLWLTCDWQSGATASSRDGRMQLDVTYETT